MKKFIISIDQGTTSSRVVLYDTKFNIIDILQKEFKQYFPKDGWVEHNALEIWRDVKILVKKILKKNIIKSSDILSIGITNQRETTVLWDRKILKFGKCKVLIVNSGIANAYTGRKGYEAVRMNAQHAAKYFNCKQSEIYISSTGVIGKILDYKKINLSINRINKSKKSSFIKASKAIMTTDTYPKIKRNSFCY